jgi:hypothetical protein
MNTREQYRFFIKTFSKEKIAIKKQQVCLPNKSATGNTYHGDADRAAQTGTQRGCGRQFLEQNLQTLCDAFLYTHILRDRA